MTLKIITMKMKNRSYRYDINRYRSRYGHKYTKYTTCISKCIKQHLSNMWSSANEKISLSWKKALLVKKKRVTHKKILTSFASSLKKCWSQNKVQKKQEYWPLITLYSAAKISTIISTNQSMIWLNWLVC